MGTCLGLQSLVPYHLGLGAWHHEEKHDAGETGSFTSVCRQEKEPLGLA